MIKKLISYFLLVLLSLQTFVVHASDIADKVLKDNSSLLYVGILEDFDSIAYPLMPNDKITSMVFKVSHVYKGDAKPDELIEYENTNIYEKLNIGDTYLIVDFTGSQSENNSLYVYKISSLDAYKITLEQSGVSDDAALIEDDINSGVVEMAESERKTIGQRLSLNTYLDSQPDKVIFTYKGDKYSVNTDAFNELAKDVYITNVPDMPLGRIGEESAYDEILYIELFDKNDEIKSYMSVSEEGEVSKNSPSMSLLPSCQYQMDIEGLNMLYNLMRDTSTEILTLTSAPTKWYDDVNKMVIGMVVILAVIIVSLTVYLYRFHNKRR